MMHGQNHIRCFPRYVSSKKCPYWQSEGTLRKSQSRALSHSPVDLSDFVFTNVHISCLLYANRKVLRQDRKKISFYNLLAESPTERRLCFVLRLISAWSTVRWEKRNRLISSLWLVVGRLVNTQINTTRWSRLYFISSFRSVQLSINFWAKGINR